MDRGRATEGDHQVEFYTTCWPIFNVVLAKCSLVRIWFRAYYFMFQLLFVFVEVNKRGLPFFSFPFRPLPHPFPPRSDNLHFLTK